MIITIAMGVVFFTLSFMAAPIFVAVGLAAFSGILVGGGVSFTLLPQRLIAGMYSYPLLAIPFFLLAAAFMGQGGMTQRIVNVFNSLFGHIRGSLAMTDVGASMFFAGISGSGVADATSIGAIVIPAMKEEGYPADFAAALTAAAAVTGPIIPPSIPFVIYGVAAQVSILDLFMCGAIPGVVLGLSLMGYAYVVATRRGFPIRGRASFRHVVQTLWNSVFALVMPIFLLAGIFLGIFTVTELAAIAVVYSFIIGFFVYRTLKLRDIPGLMAEVGLATAAVMILIGTTMLLAYLLSVYKIPSAIMSFFFSISGNKYVFLILVNILFLILGMCMDSTPATLMAVPVLLPVAKALGIDPIHFGLIMVFNLMLGLLTPPVCFCLSITAEIAKISLAKAWNAVIIPLIIGLAVLGLITFWPAFGMTLVRLYK
jgi:tripartite ATP-independent transporter DctM subunit